MDYTAVAMAIRRFETRAENARYLSQLMQAVKMNVKSEDVTLSPLWLGTVWKTD